MYLTISFSLCLLCQNKICVTENVNVNYESKLTLLNTSFFQTFLPFLYQTVLTHRIVVFLLSQKLTWTFDALSILKDKLARFVNLSVKNILMDATPDFASGNESPLEETSAS